MNYEDELDRSRARKSRRRESESETSANAITHRTEDLYSMSADPGSRAGRAQRRAMGQVPTTTEDGKRKQEEKDHYRCSDRPDRSGPGVCRSGLRHISSTTSER